jgi:AraC-like DNA-binding protein
MAHFSVEDAKGDTALLLGRITHPPYKLIWNTDDVPNQLFKGMSFSADAQLKNGHKVSKSLGGIFLAGKRAFHPSASIPFGIFTENPLFTKTVSSGRVSSQISAWACWTPEGVRLSVKALGKIPTQRNNYRRNVVAEFCIDPSLARGPYPAENAFSITIPADGPPFKTVFRAAQTPDGNFSVVSNEEKCNCRFETGLTDFQVFSASVVIPAALFGESVPDSFGCNIIVRIPGDSAGELCASWIDAPASELYSPFLWATVSKLPRPLIFNPSVLGLAGFAAGLLCSVVAGILVLFARRRNVTFEEFEQTEDEKRLSDQIYQYIDETVTRKDLTLVGVAQKLSMKPARVGKLIRKHKGRNFQDFVAFLRVEIAKERLRSSHSSETSIAESCGFKTVSEMEKYFRKFCRTSPLSFRKENQVS